MLKKNIAEFYAFVILAAASTLFLTACFSALSGDPANGSQTSSDYEKPKVAGRLESPDITESSGLAASRCQPNVLWTHNDSGDNAYIFAIDTTGKHLGAWQIPNAQNFDWEDVAAFKDKSGECFLYIGEIGNNRRARSEFTIYRLKEPKIVNEISSKKKPLTTENADQMRFAYPDFRHDAEALIVHPETADIYILTKRASGASGVYKLESNFAADAIFTAEKIADFSVPAVPNGLLTGAGISPDGKRVVICDYYAGYEIRLPDGAKKIDEIWKEKPVKINLGKRAIGEAVTYSADGNSIYATSEKKHSQLIEVRRKASQQKKTGNE